MPAHLGETAPGDWVSDLSLATHNTLTHLLTLPGAYDELCTHIPNEAEHREQEFTQTVIMHLVKGFVPFGSRRAAHSSRTVDM